MWSNQIRVTGTPNQNNTIWNGNAHQNNQRARANAGSNSWRRPSTSNRRSTNGRYTWTRARPQATSTIQDESNHADAHMTERPVNRQWRQNSASDQEGRNYGRRRYGRQSWYNNNNHTRNNNSNNNGVAFQNTSFNEGTHNARLYNNGRRGRFNWRRNRRAAQADEVAPQAPESAVELGELPGYVYDPLTDRYFKVQADSDQAAFGFRRDDFNRQKIIEAHKQQLRQKVPRKAISMPKFLQDRELNRFGATSNMRRHAQMSFCKSFNRADCIQEIVNDEDNEFLTDCHFLEVNNDGRMITGCWTILTVESDGFLKTGTRIMCLRVTIDEYILRRTGEAKDRDDTKFFMNTYGIQIHPAENPTFTLSTKVMDMTIAQMDNDITCVLYVAPNSRHDLVNNPRYKVAIEPLIDLCNEEDSDEIGSPIYNVRWFCHQVVNCCAFNNRKMRIGIGTEKNAMIMDFLTEKRCTISSCSKSVISQQFSPEGDMLYMGLRGTDMCCADLRLSNDHVVATFDDSKSAGFMRILRTDPNYLISESFGGSLKLWDIRMRKSVINYAEHVNSHSKVPCYVEGDEQFLFAVGNDGAVRGFSITNGTLVCTIPSPDPFVDKGEFPRVIYCQNWGGVVGNAAVMVSEYGIFRVYELRV